MFDWLKRLFAASETLPEHASSTTSVEHQRPLKDEAAFWTSVRTQAEKKIGAKLPDKVWNEEAVREKWRQRLNIVR